jgi:protein arginine kinase
MGKMLKIALSSRARAMRNVCGHQFTSTAPSDELIEIAENLIAKIQAIEPSILVYKSLTLREREELISERLISPDFPSTLPGRAVLVSRDRTMSLMINEEDHLRAQVILPGYALELAAERLHQFLNRLSANVDFAQTPDLGYLSTSIFNLGSGVRYSVMMHLVGVAMQRNLREIIDPLVNSEVTVRGLFGESSRPIGAFAQVSTTSASLTALNSACQNLIHEETQARDKVNFDEFENGYRNAVASVKGLSACDLPTSIRILGWIRWRACQKSDEDISLIDRALACLPIPAHADAARAELLSALLLQTG